MPLELKFPFESFLMCKAFHNKNSSAALQAISVCEPWIAKRNISFFGVPEKLSMRCGNILTLIPLLPPSPSFLGWVINFPFSAYVGYAFAEEKKEGKELKTAERDVKMNRMVFHSIMCALKCLGSGSLVCTPQQLICRDFQAIVN